MYDFVVLPRFPSFPSARMDGSCKGNTELDAEVKGCQGAGFIGVIRGRVWDEGDGFGGAFLKRDVDGGFSVLWGGLSLSKFKSKWCGDSTGDVIIGCISDSSLFFFVKEGTDRDSTF